MPGPPVDEYVKYRYVCVDATYVVICNGYPGDSVPIPIPVDVIVTLINPVC